MHLRLFAGVLVLVVASSTAVEATTAPQPCPSPRNDAPGNGSMRDFIYNGDIDAVRACLDRGTSVDHANENGHTALHDAACWGRRDIVSLLIARGADLQARDRYGYTPAQWVAAQSSCQADSDILDLLREPDVGGGPTPDVGGGPTPNRPSYYYCVAFESATNLVWFSEVGEYESRDTYDEDERYLESRARRFVRFLQRDVRWGNGFPAQPFTDDDAPATELVPRCLSEFSGDEAWDSRDGAMDEVEAVDFNGVGLNTAIVDWP